MEVITVLKVMFWLLVACVNENTSYNYTNSLNIMFAIIIVNEVTFPQLSRYWSVTNYNYNDAILVTFY